MKLYLYTDKDTFFHRLDPRTKLCLLVVSFVLALLYGHPWLVGGAIVLIVLHACAARVVSNVLRAWGLFVCIIFFSALIWGAIGKGPEPLCIRCPFAPGDEPDASVWRIGWRATPPDAKEHLWRFSGPPLLFGLSTGLKLSAMIAAGLILLSTTKNEEISLGLIRLGVPYPIAFAFSTALRLVPTFVGTGVTVVQAQRSRGLDLDTGGVLARARKYIPLLGPIFLTTLRSTNQLAMALEATVEDLAHTIHPHPTLSEGVMEAAMALLERPIHM